MSERKTNPTIVPKITRPGESLQKTGSRRVSELLPDILQTTVNKQFFDSTFEQLMASGSLEPVKHFVGKTVGNDKFTPSLDDSYLVDGRSNDTYQFTPGMINKNDDSSIDQALAYDDLIRSLKYNEVNTNNHSKILNETAFTLDLPINLDMFINHHRYYWVLDVLPPSPLHYTSSFDIDTIIGETTYTTPIQKNGRALAFENGMRIRFNPHTVDRFIQTVLGNQTFTASVTGAVRNKVYVNNVRQPTSAYTYNSVTGVVTLTTAPALNEEVEIHTFYSFSTSGDYLNDAIYIVDGVGDPDGIQLTKQFEPGQYEGTQGKRVWANITTYSSQEPAGFDADQFAFDFKKYDLREHRMTTRDYTCEQRTGPDKNAWSRSNLWVHEQTIANSLIYDGYANVKDDLYALDRYRAVRPIIEYKAGLEKYNTGTRHILNVDHVLNDDIDPATLIVGKTSYNLKPGSFTEEWSNKGYSFRDKVKVTSGVAPNLVITFWECVQAHGELRNPTHGANREFWEQVVPVELEDGDFILFLESTNNAYKDKIFEVSGVGTSIVLTERYNDDGTNSATQLLSGDKIVILNGYNYEDTDGGISDRTFPFSGSEIFWNGTEWIYGQQKQHRSQGMKVQLYDTNLVKLDDANIYPNSDFFGATIFDFVHSDTGSYDDALGFVPEYVDYGNNPGLNFDADLLNKRFTYVNQSTDLSKSNQEEIKGYYYYKYFTNSRYHNGWTPLRNGQQISKQIRKVISDSSVPLRVDVGHESFVGDRYYNIFKEFGLLGVSSQPSSSVLSGRVQRIGGKLPTLFFHYSNTYTINTLFPQAEIEFVNMDGTAISTGLTRTAGTNNKFEIQVGTPTVNSIKYRLVADPTNFGVIFLNDNPSETNVTVLKNGEPFTNFSHTGDIISITSGLIKDDIYEFSFFSKKDYRTTGEGEFEPAHTQIHNAQNLDFSKISYGDLIQHFSNQMTSNPLFTGNWYGTNNYRNIVQVNDIGGTIRQQPYSTELLNQLLVDVSTNPYSALQFASSNYEQFKEKFKRKIVQLHESLDQTLPIYTLVDKTLEALNLGKNADSSFAHSEMAMYRDYKSIDVSWILDQTPVFDLPEAVNNYDDTFNHVQVWIQIPDSNGNHSWKSLVKGLDYLINQNRVTIIAPGINSFPGTGLNNAHIRWYKRNSVSFVPPSAVKLGLIKPYVPELRADYSVDSDGSFTGNVVIGHDGSVYVRQGTEIYNRQQAGFNPVDAGIWDLENRIYNNLGADLSQTVNVSTYFPNAHRPAVYTWDELNNSIRSEFNKYKSENNITVLNSSTYYDGSDKWTWNYSSVGPGIGGWRGIYTYYFNTERPHTHPWEMLGHNSKPTWWDANYSWTDAAKRAALLLALQDGQTSDPALGANNQTYDINYAYNNYDWNNDTLVTLLGILNDPDTANVVPTPSAGDASKDFVYGDFGPVEAEWRRSSAGKLALVLAFLRTRPLIVLNNYFRTARRQVKNLAGYDHPQEIDTDKLKLDSWKNTNLSGSSITGKIIESIKIINPGSGYTIAPDVTVNDNFGIDGEVTVFVENGSIRSASVTKQGEQYFNRPLLGIATGGAELDPILAENATHYYNGLSNAVIEFSNLYGTGADTLRNRLENLSFQPMIKAGGFVNRNNQFILESSQDKGRVFVPEENISTVMYTSKPDVEFFFGGIKISKTANGYTLNGFDNSLSYFVYNKPKTATPGISVQFQGTTNITVLRYRVFDETTTQLDYNTELRSIQEVYNFISGYGHYLNNLGFTQQWRSSAANFVTWAIGNSTTDITLIPDDTKIIVNDGSDGYFDNINKKYDGVYNIINEKGKQISSTDLIIDRKSMEPDSETVFQVKDADSVRLYGIRLYKVQLEHAFVFDNITNFDDVIYDSSIAQRHNRIVWRGSRTKDWNGKLYSPGYIVDENTVIPNYDTVAREVDQYLGRTNTLSNKQLSDIARFNAGYNKPDWSKNLDFDDDSLYEFVKGSYKYRGTDHALTAFMRNQELFDGEASAELLEQWAIRTADFGDTSTRGTLEFQITPDLLKTSPQPVRISAGQKFDVLSDIVIDIDATSPLKVHDSTENNFLTRPVNTFKDSSDELFAQDYTTAGLPLLSEADYKVINKEDFEQFPEEVKESYDHSGDWKDIGIWDSNVSYKFNEKVLHKGKTWSMIDEDGASGIATASDPIELKGTIQLPVVPSTGQTLVIDGNTVTLSKSATSTTTNIIQVPGTVNIASTNVVPHGSTLILGSSSTINTTVTFSNIVSTTTFVDIEKIGSTINPTIQGSATATLIIDGTTVNFNDPQSSNTNITAQQAYENSFNTSWIQNQSSISSSATTRIQRIEGLRAAYIASNSAAAWTTWITTYYTNNAGLNISHLLTLIQGGGSTQQPAEFLLDQDLVIINNIKGTSYVGTQVISGAQIVGASDITDSQAAMNNGTYTDDIATYLKDSANASTTFAPSTVVVSITTPGFKLYTLTDIVQEINDAGISNVTASADASSRLKITKTTNTPAVTFTLTISVGTENANVGFSTATESISSSSNTQNLELPLSLQQTIDQINDAGISGITASAGTSNTNVLQINSTLANLFIGTGTANSPIGLPSGLVPASTTTATSNVGLNIIDIVEKINNANISGVSATNASNKLRLTSTNSTMVIGAGTANTTVGITAQTLSATQSATSAVFEAIVDSNGNPVFTKDTNDPNIFAIWVADDSEFGSYNLGYQVYQTMDFGIYTFDICAGPDAGDDAEIKVNRQTGDVQAHNLSVGDYILIRGSNSVPNIDGIHKVTKVSNQTNKFYIDEFIEQNGSTGNIYPLRKMRFPTYAALEADRQIKINDVYKYNFAGVRQALSANPIYAYVDDDGTGQSAVYSWTGTWSDTNGHIGSWKQVRTGIAQARNDLIENIKLYDAEKQSTITTLEVFDPAKGIIFGFVDKEIDYKITNDIANYNFNNIDGSITNDEQWGREYLGARWWNTSTAVYLDYEQSTVDYQQNNWGKLFDGSSIDIYEWTASPVPPEQWSELVTQKAIVDNKEASGEAYSVTINGQTVYNWTEENYYNEASKQTETVYYFWIKNKTNSIRNSNYNVFQLAQIMLNPNAFDLSWSAQAGNDTLLLANIRNFVNKDTVAQLNQKNVDLALPMQDWVMLAEKDPNITIPEYLHVKIRDSLAGFNRFSVDKPYTTWNNTTVYADDQVVKEGTDFYVSLQANNQGNQPSIDTDMSHWSRVYDYNFIEDTQADDISVWRGQPVPDLKLHKYNRYGFQTRPRQSLFRDVKEARQNFVHSVNSLLSTVNVIDEINNWENAFTDAFTEGAVTYKVKDYTNLVDWHLVETDTDGNETFRFNPNTVADIVYNTRTDYVNAGDPVDGSYILVKSTSPGADIDRSEMYYYINGEDKLVFKEKATVQLSEEIWNQSKFGNGFDAIGLDVTPFDACSDNVISRLMDLLRSEIFIGTHHVKYNQMWFKLLFTAILQNTADDFAFKTTFAHLGIKRPLLINKDKYQSYDINVVEEYVNSIKPFHTKLLSSMESNTHGESTNIEIEDIERNSVITLNYEDHSIRSWEGDTILLGGDFTSTPTGDIDQSEFTTANASFSDDYNGNVFQQAVLEGFGEELVATDFTENINILVQTNESGAVTVTAGPTYSVNSEETGPRGMTFNDNGTKMFVCGTTGDDVNEYTLSNGFDLSSTVTFVDSYAVTECPNPTAVKFSFNGTKMFVTGVGNSNVHEYALTTGFDVSTATFTQTLVTTVDSDNFGLDFKPDGTKMYITGDQNNKIYEYNLSTGFDISTATFNQDLVLTAIDVEPFGIEWSPDGTRLFIVGTRGNGVDEFRAGTPWDITTLTHIGFYSIGGNPSGIHFSPDGLQMFITGNTSDLVKSYTLSDPYRLLVNDGVTDGPDSRTFRMVYYMPTNIQESNAIVDAQKTTTTADINTTDTTIPVTDATVLDDPNITLGANPGVVYIGNERIEYQAINANDLLFCTRGTLGTSAVEHTSGASVINSGQTTKIPTVDKFSHYGDGLRLAYNDSGISLSATGTTPEHAFIRNVGKGTI